jgi:hypothetical protein
MAGSAPSAKEDQDRARQRLATAEPNLTREAAGSPAGYSNSAGLAAASTPAGLGNAQVAALQTQAAAAARNAGPGGPRQSIGLVDQLTTAIYTGDRENVRALLNQAGIEAALALLAETERLATGKGQIHPSTYVAEFFPLASADVSSLRAAVVARTLKIARSDWEAGPEEEYDALADATDRLASATGELLARGAVDHYLAARGPEVLRGIIETRSKHQLEALIERAGDVNAAKSDPLGVFRRKLKDKTLKRLAENESAVRKQQKELAADASSAAWDRLRGVVVPKAIYYAQLGTLEENLDSMVRHTIKAVRYAKDQRPASDDLAATEYSIERGEPPEDAWWRPNRFPLGGGGANSPPPTTDIEAELEIDRAALMLVRTERASLRQRFPLLKALRQDLIDKLKAGPRNSDAAAIAEFRASAFHDLQRQVFVVALDAINQLSASVESGDARLFNYGPLIEETRAELALDSEQDAKINDWIAGQQTRDQVITIGTAGLTIGLSLAALAVPGLGAAVLVSGVANALYGAGVAGDAYVAAKAGSAGQDITAESLEDARSGANWALLNLTISGVALGSAVLKLSAARGAIGAASAVDEVSKGGSLGGFSRAGPRFSSSTKGALLGAAMRGFGEGLPPVAGTGGGISAPIVAFERAVQQSISAPTKIAAAASQIDVAPAATAALSETPAVVAPVTSAANVGAALPTLAPPAGLTTSQLASLAYAASLATPSAGVTVVPTPGIQGPVLEQDPQSRLVVATQALEKAQLALKAAQAMIRSRQQWGQPSNAERILLAKAQLAAKLANEQWKAAQRLVTELELGKVGQSGEAHFRGRLEKSGYKNVRSFQNDSGNGIDLVGELGDETFFFEVKTSEGPTAPGLSADQENIGTFVRSRLRQALGWKNLTPEQHADAEALLVKIENGMEIKGKVIEITDARSSSPKVTAYIWSSRGKGTRTDW